MRKFTYILKFIHCICKFERTSVASTSEISIGYGAIKIFLENLCKTSHSCAVYLSGRNTSALEITLTAGNHSIIFENLHAREGTRDPYRENYSRHV